LDFIEKVFKKWYSLNDSAALIHKVNLTKK